MSDIFFPPGIDETTQARTKKFFHQMEDYWGGFDTELPQLLKQGICLEAKWDDATPLMHAVNWGCVDIVSALIAAGADIEARDNRGEMALIKAAKVLPNITGDRDNKIKIAKILLNAGANIEARDYQGKTALSHALSTYDNAMTNMFLAFGANMYAAGGAYYINNNEVEWEFWLDWYERFHKNGQPPSTISEVHNLLAFTPLADPKAPADYTANLRHILFHAKWKDKGQAASILKQLQQNGRINAETANSIMADIFPHERVISLQHGRRGR